MDLIRHMNSFQHVVKIDPTGETADLMLNAVHGYLEWLGQQGLTPGFDYAVTSKKTGFNSNGTALFVYHYKFKRANDAVLFKLTFGGT